uniref:Uncharacterized protein n=1 Tax=Globodera rostochiensis TaxID=31243 RepID=A0A914HSV9_GLORO
MLIILSDHRPTRPPTSPAGFDANPAVAASSYGAIDLQKGHVGFGIHCDLNLLRPLSRRKDVQSNSSEQLQDQEAPDWRYLLQQNGILDDQLTEMARDMDEDEPFIDELSDKANYKPPPPSPAHPTFEKTYSRRFISPSVEFGVDDQNKTQKLEGQSGSLANVYRKIAKFVQKLAKTFVMLKHLLMKKGTIGSEIVAKINKAIKIMAKERGISLEKIEKFNSKMELREIVKNAAVVWSETARNKHYVGNGKENTQKMVELWQLIRKNEEFINYLNKNQLKEAKNQSQKRRAKRTDPLTAAAILLVVACFVFFFIWLGIIWIADWLGAE